MKLISTSLISSEGSDVSNGFFITKSFYEYLEFLTMKKFDFSMSYSKDKSVMYFLQTVHPFSEEDLLAKWNLLVEKEQFDERKIIVTRKVQNAFYARQR